MPIILDDALVYCDDDRINLMFDALSRAGKHQQIIVLTCRLRSFASWAAISYESRWLLRRVNRGCAVDGRVFSSAAN